MRITIVGTGYVGLVAGTCFAETGNEVLGLDIDAAKIERLSRGEIPIYEPGLSDLFHRNMREGRLSFTCDAARAAAHGALFFLCLPTPPAEDGSADTRHVLAAATGIAQQIQRRTETPVPQTATSKQPLRPTLFVLKSTVPVGTQALLQEALEKVYPGGSAVVSNPEFLKEGAAVEDFLKPDRVVIGTRDDGAFETLRTLYEPYCRSGAPILRMDPASAELTKYAANGFLATKISFINEIARLCEATGADVELVRKGIAADARIGRAFLFPGLGYGGSCFPKDTRALVASARARGLQMSIVNAAEGVNETQKTILFPRIMEHLRACGWSLEEGLALRTPEPRKRPAGALDRPVVALWGLAFKPRTDDIREAPALALAEKLHAAGVGVQAYDPEAMANAQRVLGEKIRCHKDPYAALEGAAALILVTEWNEFRTPDWERVKGLLKHPAIFDGRNIYDARLLRERGFSYWGIGRL